MSGLHQQTLLTAHGNTLYLCLTRIYMSTLYPSPAALVRP